MVSKLNGIRRIMVLILARSLPLTEIPRSIHSVSSLYKLALLNPMTYFHQTWTYFWIPNKLQKNIPNPGDVSIVIHRSAQG